MGRPEKQFSFSYSKIADITGKTTNAVVQAVNRGDFDPNDLHSMMCYAIKHARPAFKKRYVNTLMGLDK